MLEYWVSAERIDSHGSVASTEEAEITLDTDIEGRPSGRPDEEDRADRCKSGRREGPARHRPCGILGALAMGPTAGDWCLIWNRRLSLNIGAGSLGARRQRRLRELVKSQEARR